MSADLPFHMEENGNAGIIRAEKQFFTGKCILDVSAEMSDRFNVTFDAKSDPDAIIVKISPKDGGVSLSESDLRDFMNGLIDHQTWLDLNEKFGSIRETIVAEAFAPLKKL